MQCIISERNNLRGSFFFSNFMKILEMQKKIQEILLEFEIIAFELVALDTCFYWERILVIGCQYVNKQSQDFSYYQDRISRADILSNWSKNMTKILPWRFKRSFGSFNMVTVHKCSDTRPFRHLSNPGICNLKFQKQITFEAHLLFQSIANFM